MTGFFDRLRTPRRKSRGFAMPGCQNTDGNVDMCVGDGVLPWSAAEQMPLGYDVPSARRCRAARPPLGGGCRRSRLGERKPCGIAPSVSATRCHLPRNGFPRQCAHWLGMTGERGGQSRPPYRAEQEPRGNGTSYPQGICSAALHGRTPSPGEMDSRASPTRSSPAAYAAGLCVIMCLLNPPARALSAAPPSRGSRRYGGCPHALLAPAAPGR